VATDTLTDLSFAKMLRARRDHVPYLMKLLAKLDADGREGLALMLCENVVPRHPVRRFRRRLRTLRLTDGDETETDTQSATYAD
ncbi:MAG: phosphoadenosine phosphosulfate reductase, partial [Pseudomonadota bacterium]|nr:phosphoadenosine phosphosulfate reductase [Pseudomonadota bacterium]